MYNKILSVVIISAVNAFSVFAQKEEPVDKYAASIKAEDASKHLTILAADWMEGRETGERGQKMAAAYIADQFKNFGLKPVVKEGGEYSYFQKFDLEKRAWKDVSIVIGDTSKKVFLKDFYLYGDFDIPVAEKTQLVFGGYGIDAANYSDYKFSTGKFHTDIKGKTVIIFSGEPQKDSMSAVTKTKAASVWANDWRKKATTAKALGAKNVIVIVGNSDNDFNNRLNQIKVHLEAPTLAFTHKSRPSSAIFVPISLAAKMLNTTTEDLIKMRDERSKAIINSKSPKKITPLSFSLKVEVEKTKVSTENVLGLIEGTDKKDEIVVLTAHYDHIGKEGNVVYNGADDDGSGTTALLELAEAFSMAAREGYRPRRSILIMPVTAEEKGLMGSEYYTDKPVFPLAKTVVDLNIDMIGRLDSIHANDPNYVYIIGSNRLSTQLHTISEEANKRAGEIKLDYRYNSFDDPNRFYFRSDHYNFAKNGIPVIFYFNGVHADYHKPTDTVDKISFGKLARITQLVFYTAWELANREDRIVVDVKE